ncbi:MAG TPA: response regulator [Bacteroidota bacterium]|nr:response regulator [Bacteroidota bacterium]
MPTSTLSPEERNSRVSALLRQVDEDVKVKNFDQALDKIRKVYEYDIKNIYARAYEERILMMMMEQGREEALRDAKKQASEQIDQEVKRRLRDFYRQQEVEAQKRKQDERTEQALEERARQASVNEVRDVTVGDISTIEKETAQRTEVLEKKLLEKLQQSAQLPNKATSEQLADVETERRKIQEEAFNKLKQEQQRTQAELVQRMEDERTAAIGREQSKAKQRELEAYHSLMKMMMQLAIPSEWQTSILQSLKISFSISDAEHMTAEREVQVNAYIEAVRTLWTNGKPTEEDFEQLKRLQQFFHITDEEHADMTKRMKKELGLADETAVIAVIDDDLSIRKYVEHILRKTYHTVIVAASAESILPELAKVTPNLIISDINLGTGVMSGFSFYEKIKAGTYGDALKNIPFVLMSSLEDDFFIKTAKQMGVRAYMSKPFTRESLEALVQKTLQ